MNQICLNPFPLVSFGLGFSGKLSDIDSTLARCCLPLVVVLRSLLASFFLVVVFGTAVTMSQGIAPDFREPGTAMMTLFQISVGCLGAIRAYPLAISQSMKMHEVLMDLYMNLPWWMGIYSWPMFGTNRQYYISQKWERPKSQREGDPIGDQS